VRDDLLATVDSALGEPGRWQDKTLLVALSGGVDSTVLLEVLTLLQPRHGYRLEVAHIHHGLQPIAETWPLHCAQQAQQRGLVFHLKHVDVSLSSGLGVEAAARLARYQALNTIPADLVVLGHHLDDQAESVFLQLLRGSGPAGLAGMGIDELPAGHPLQTPVLRPLLALPRHQIMAWALEKQLTWIEDPSNQSLAMDRNYLRLEVTPRLNQRFRSWRQGLARSAQWAAEAQSLLVELAEQDVAHIQSYSLGKPDLKSASDRGHEGDDAACLPGQRLAYLTLTDHRLRNVLRVLLTQRGASAPPAPRLIEWIRQLRVAHSDSIPLMIWQGWALRCWGEKLWLEREVKSFEHSDQPLYLEWEGRAPQKWEWPGGGEVEMVYVDREETFSAQFGVLLPNLIREDCGALTLKIASGAAKIQPSLTQPHRVLRNLFQEARVPPWRRGRMPMLHCARKLVGVPGLAVDPSWQAPAGHPGWQLIWRDPGLTCYNLKLFQSSS